MEKDLRAAMRLEMLTVLSGLGAQIMMSTSASASLRTRALCSRYKISLGAFTAVALAVTLQPAHAVTYTFQDVIDNADPTFNQELGINSAGTIAGYFGAGNGLSGHPNKGYTVVPPYAQANFTNENFPNSVQTQVTGLNNIGTTVGFWAPSNNGGDNNFGFTDVGGTFTTVNNPATPPTGTMINQLLGVNDGNVAVGFYTDAAGVTHGYTYTIATNTFSANIDDPNAVGNTTAAAINNAGEVAGFYTDAAGNFHGFIDNGGMFTTLDAAGAVDTSLLGLNNLGEAVGFDIDAAMTMHGIVCSVTALTCQQVDDPNGIGTTTFNGVNDAGKVVGFYVNGEDNTIGLLATPAAVVPEPATITLLATGLFGIGAVRRRRSAG
jgi:PEP-CTERM motif